MTEPLGVAVVGLGVGEAHARAYAALERCDVRWLYDLDESRAHALQRALGRGRVARSFAEILDDRDVGLVSIASYDDAHCDQVVRALGAGKHVFVEKPLSRTIEELRQVKQAWQRAGRHLASNLILRAAPLYGWLRRAIDEGELGTLYAFDGDYLYGRIHKITDGWRGEVPDYSVMHGGGVHLVDLMLWLTGERPTRVAAAGNRIATTGTTFRRIGTSTSCACSGPVAHSFTMTRARGFIPRAIRIACRARSTARRCPRRKAI
jgi:predicted dehydrogenase